eukprot:CAMPEP_0171303268 /NCGR_PEP_ID=MMETSP0816-20121228/12788_1 /TAXON_ID=420281 /ORGANISM="Proboscia inermis, Strain CCAP1064/1" /LENGTH=282 /DNA_ID=CAMNT_0011782407 /DNA_START=53 /DNA_END=901 /DNA_ORIENTATION=+
MNLKVFTSLALVLFDTANAVPSFVPKAAATKQALSIRGGGSPLDPDIAAKVLIGALSVQGAYSYLAPNKSMRMYNITDDKLSTLLTEAAGGYFLMYAITAYGVLFTDMSTIKAIGAAQIPFALSFLRNILSGEFESCGCGMPVQWLNLAIISFAAYACLSGADYATTAAKALAVYIGLATTQFRFAPEAALETWGIDLKDRSPVAIFEAKCLGQLGIINAVLIGALISNVDAYKSLGYSGIPALICLALMKISGDFEKIGFEVAKIYPWMALVAVSLIPLLF